MRQCPNCGREFDHDPETCWDCGATTIDQSSQSFLGDFDE